ncbi:hypothetical protein T4C_14118 [Trichinella pseudospiralis]|uniref:Uncharacterized protein n=1 Tax=Trichinella pseudospiralis TaxID=6337 RepID=A0A0V1K4I8_TRIPS|nr:hypothetical protein T4C_14118 [Trichinella pseudospiralis]
MKILCGVRCGGRKVSWIKEKAAVVVLSSSVFALDCLIKYILIVCCFVVAMPSLKREAERKGKAAANTGSSPNSEGRANSLAEETDEPARGSGSLHLKRNYYHGIIISTIFE